MKKLIIPFALFFLLCCVTCKKEQGDVNQQGQAEFTFSSGRLKSLSDSAPMAGLTSVVVTIEDAEGKTVKNSEKIDLYYFNGNYISKPLALQTGSYILTRFLVLDRNNNVVYASPQKGSQKAYLVQKSLPVSFSVKENNTVKITAEVLSTAESTPEDFGYSAFGFSVAETFDFRIGVFAYNDSVKNFVMTTASLTILKDSTDVLYERQLDAKKDSMNASPYDSVGVTNKITLPERYSSFTIIVSKQGYKNFRKTFTKEALRLYCSSLDNGPLVVILDKVKLKVVTNTITNITQNTALSGGSITITGSETVTSRGICWSTHTFPAIDGSKTMDGSGFGIFNSAINGLMPFTTYYARAYAITPQGIVYGNEVCFTTAGWIQKASMPTEGRLSAVSFSINGKGYVGTGRKIDGTYLSDFWEYDPSADKWTRKADFPGGVRTGATGFAVKGKGYICLGSGDNITTNFKGDLWEYDPVKNAWLQKADFPGKLRYNPKSFVIGDTAFAGTGTYNAGNDYLYDMWMYVPSTNTWTRKADFAGSHRNGAVAFQIGNYGYVGLGAIDNMSRGKDVWKYDKTTDTWSIIADYPGSTRVSACSFTLGDKAYVGTGEDGTNHYSTFYEYNPDTDTWTLVIPNGAPVRTNSTGFSIGNIGYFATGNYGSTAYSDLWAYSPGFVRK